MKKIVVIFLIFLSCMIIFSDVKKFSKGKVFWFNYPDTLTLETNNTYALFERKVNDGRPIYFGKRGSVFIKKNKVLFYDKSLSKKEIIILPFTPSTWIRDFEGKRIAFGYLFKSKFLIKILNISMRKITDSLEIDINKNLKIIGFFGRRVFLEDKKSKKIYSYSIFSRRLMLFLEGYEKLVGIGDYGSSVVFWDANKDLIFRRGNRSSKIRFAEFEKGCAYNSLDTIAYSTKKKIFLYNVNKKKNVNCIDFDKGDFKIFSISQQGKRVFSKAKGRLLIFDFYDKSFYSIKEINPKEISEFESLCDGEINIFYMGKTYFLYLKDLSSPEVLFKLHPSISKNITFYKKPFLRVWVFDKCVLSGASPDVKVFVNKKSYKGKKIHPELSKGENFVRLIVMDNAKNRKTIKTKIFYNPPLRVKLSEIDNHPRNYNGKIVVLKGFAWGYNIKIDQVPKRFLETKILKRNSYVTKNSGYFSDGKNKVFMPVPPNEKGFYKVYAKIKVKKDKIWVILPLFVETYTP